MATELHQPLSVLMPFEACLAVIYLVTVRLTSSPAALNLAVLPSSSSVWNDVNFSELRDLFIWDRMGEHLFGHFHEE